MVLDSSQPRGTAGITEARSREPEWASSTGSHTASASLRGRRRKAILRPRGRLSALFDRGRKDRSLPMGRCSISAAATATGPSSWQGERS